MARQRQGRGRICSRNRSAMHQEMVGMPDQTGRRLSQWTYRRLPSLGYSSSGDPRALLFARSEPRLLRSHRARHLPASREWSGIRAAATSRSLEGGRRTPARIARDPRSRRQRCRLLGSGRGLRRGVVHVKAWRLPPCRCDCARQTFADLQGAGRAGDCLGYLGHAGCRLSEVQLGVHRSRLRISGSARSGLSLPRVVGSEVDARRLPVHRC